MIEYPIIKAFNLVKDIIYWTYSNSDSSFWQYLGDIELLYKVDSHLQYTGGSHIFACSYGCDNWTITDHHMHVTDDTIAMHASKKIKP